ncbi:hypothetical protein D3C84_1148640 [compost metagenome]
MERVSWLRGRTIQVRMTQRVSSSPSPKIPVRISAEVRMFCSTRVKRVSRE